MKTAKELEDFCTEKVNSKDFYEELREDLLRIQSLYSIKYEQKNVLDSLIENVKNDRAKGSPYPELNLEAVN